MFKSSFFGLHCINVGSQSHVSIKVFNCFLCRNFQNISLYLWCLYCSADSPAGQKSRALLSKQPLDPRVSAPLDSSRSDLTDVSLDSCSHFYNIRQTACTCTVD